MSWQGDYLTQRERDKLLDDLTEQQKKFVNDYLKRGRRTVFANVLAKEKAGNVADEDTEKVAEQWELLDYLDAGPNWQNEALLFCECGRVLRYQYIVQNHETGETKKFGIRHFEEHTGIPPHLVREIVKGIERIDFELDEILVKISSNWTLVSEGLDKIHPDVQIPNDIQTHLDLNIPLLDRQVVRLKKKVAELYQEQERQQRLVVMQEREKAQKQREEEYAKKRQAVAEKLEIGEVISHGTDIQLEQKLQLAVMVFLESLTEPQFFASEVCEELVTIHAAPGDTFSSGKYKIFPHVCSFLENLTEQGILAFVGKQGAVDRVYRTIDQEQKMVKQ
ncbi:DUF3895 domain-containing protein [Virgibacillus sp. FSP13]